MKKIKDEIIDRLNISDSVIKITDYDINIDNIINTLYKIIDTLPSRLTYRKNDVIIYMSPTNYLYYQISILKFYNISNYTLSFMGYKISIEKNMSDSYIVCCNKNTLIYTI